MRISQNSFPFQTKTTTPKSDVAKKIDTSVKKLDVAPKPIIVEKTDSTPTKVVYIEDDDVDTMLSVQQDSFSDNPYSKYLLDKAHISKVTKLLQES